MNLIKIISKRKVFLLTALVGFGLLFSASSVDALGLLFKRVVFEEGKRAEVLTVLNRTNEIKTYRISWTHFKMTEEKSLVQVAEADLPPGVKPSKDLVRFSPKRFTLGPGDTQQVRMILRTPSGLPHGEYRSHLSISPEAPAQRRKKQPQNVQGRKVIMEMLTGMSIPIIVRHGNLNVEVGVGSFSAVSTGNSINVNYNLLRTGERSVYGDVDFICNEGGRDEYLLKFIRGYAIYSEVSRRKGSHSIPKKLDAPACSALTLRFTEMSGRGEEVGAVLVKSQVAVR